MRLVGITLRMDEHHNIKERRDAIDNRWYAFLKACNITPLLLPNNIDASSVLIERNALSGFILTGGNSPGDAVERDQFEEYLLRFALENKHHVLGVCRGMQIINKYFGGKISNVSNHKAVRHTINFANYTREVNSFHELGISELASDLKIIAESNDKIIEAMEHKSMPIKGIMWHPEREVPFDSRDIKLFQEHFNI